MSPSKRIEIADRLWGWRPHATQKEWLLDDHPVKVAACGRRWGKTEASAVDVATFAIAVEGSVQMIVAPTYDQSKLISRTVERLLLSSPHTRRHTRITRTPYPEIQFRNSRMMARTADEDGRNLRGHSADRVVVDEAAFVRDEVIDEVIGPMLADCDGQLVMVSTPFGKNHFYRAFVRGQDAALTPACGRPSPNLGRGDADARSMGERCRSFRFPSWANPHISRDYIRYQRTLLTDRQFKVEYEAEFVDDQNSVFPWEDIEAAVSPSTDSTGSPQASSGQGSQQRAVHVAGIDWARYSDYTAVVVVEVDSEASGCGRALQSAIPESVSPSGDASHNPHSPFRIPQYRVVALDRFNRMAWEAQVDRVADLLCRYRVRGIAADQTSAGDPVLELLQRTLWEKRNLDTNIEGVVFTAQSKRELIDNLAIRLAHREVKFPPMEPLIQELQFYEYELTQSGHVRTGARRGYHDDCVTALALALRIAPRYRFSGAFTTSGRLREAARGW